MRLLSLDDVLRLHTRQPQCSTLFMPVEKAAWYSGLTNEQA
jgi:hypothetical protein